MNHSDSAPTKRSHTVSTQAVLITFGAVAVIAAGLYFLGLTQGRKELSVQKTQYEQQIAQSTQALDKSNVDLTEARNRNHLMQARVAIYRTAIDLDQRNFGTASERLQVAADALGLIVNDDSGIDLAKVKALKDSIESSDFSVAADLESQRALVLDFATTLDGIAADAN